MEIIDIRSCDKLQNIMLPPTLISLSVKICRGLQRVSGSGELTKLRDLIINNCPELWELSSLSRLKCMEKIDIGYCDKLQNIMLPLTLISLLVQSCRDLQRVSGSGELTKLRDLIINDCPEVKEFPSLSRLNCMEKIDIVCCDKLENIMLPLTLISLSVKSCRDFPRVSGSGELSKLRVLIINDCPELRELPSLSRLKCMEIIDIRSCDKLQSIMLPPTLISLSVKICRDLQRVSGSGELTKLRDLIINDCPELWELPSLSRLNCMEKIDFFYCDKLQNIMLPPTLISLSVQSCRDFRRVSGSGELTKLRDLIINHCAELRELPSLSRLKWMEKIDIGYCDKLQNITLPKTLISLCVQSCRGLQRLGGSGDLTKLTKLFISECPELEQLLPSLSRLSCVENIEIHSCEKIQNFMLPSTIVSLSVHSCRDLQRKVGFGEANKLTELFITECPKLDELPSLSRLNCIKKIEIDSCEKLEKTSGIEERSLQCEWIRLGSNTVIRNCIHMLKCVPGKLNMIGRAVDGAESSLSKFLFYDAYIGPDALTEIVTQNRGDVYIREWCKKWDETRAAVIVCFVVVFDSSTSAEDINFSLGRYKSIVKLFEVCDETWPKVRKGEWILTMLASDDWSYDFDFKNVEDVLSRKGVLKKGFWVEVKKGEEWKCSSVLSTIVARLYQ